jgi:Universal stress protein UspA and related nucleotide-binding proteins
MREKVGQPRIVVGVDGSPSSKQALRWAIGQARRTGATIDAISTWEYPSTYSWGPIVEGDELAKLCAQQLSDTVLEVADEDPPVPIRTHVFEGHPASVLTREAKGAQLLVVGCRGHGTFVGALLGSVSQYCVHHAPCPVVVIRPTPE